MDTCKSCRSFSQKGPKGLLEKKASPFSLLKFIKQKERMGANGQQPRLCAHPHTLFTTAEAQIPAEQQAHSKALWLILGPSVLL